MLDILCASAAVCSCSAGPPPRSFPPPSSYLGADFVAQALRREASAAGAASGRTLRFLANVDPVDVGNALDGLDPARTLVIVVSKTFSTAETMLNARTVRDWLVRSLATGADGAPTAAAVVAAHMAAVSTDLRATGAFGIAADRVFGFWDWVGGRYSVCSAVGVLPLSLHYGPPVVRRFLDGAHAMDAHLLHAPLAHNLPVLLGLLGVWNATFLGYPSRALLPYAQALHRLPAHIQQVDMESNGKRVTVDGAPLPFAAGPVNFGEPGTNGQHSFYQLLHQGRAVPADFIGFCESQEPMQLGALRWRKARRCAAGRRRRRRTRASQPARRPAGLGREQPLRSLLPSLPPSPFCQPASPCPTTTSSCPTFLRSPTRWRAARRRRSWPPKACRRR